MGIQPLFLSTDRLVLRCAENHDAHMLFKNYTSDPESARFLTRLPHANILETAKFLSEWCEIPWQNERNKFAWVVALKNTNEAIGVFFVEVDGHKAQIHYGISRAYWCQGFTTEAGRAVVTWLMMQPQLQRVWTVCEVGNYGSIKVLEKLGFQNEGVLQKWLVFPAFGDLARDCWVYARTWGATTIKQNIQKT